MVRPIPVILGPTAVGKTELSLAIARELKAEIVGADSRQIYHHLDIGTAKPDLAQRYAVPHHLIDVLDPDQPLNAARFARMAWGCIRAIEARGRHALVVGGSGLYLRALTDGLFAGPGADPRVRAFLEAEAETNGVDALHHRLAEVDPDIAKRIHPHDRVRIIRALEIYMLTGTPISQWQWNRPEQVRPFLLIGLMREREDLRARIAARTQGMLMGGLVEEVKELLAKGYPPTLPPLRSVGYAEVVAYLAGEYDLPRAQELIERHTWKLAKRQMTWFRRIAQIHWISLTGTPAETVLQAARTMLLQTGGLQEEPSAEAGIERPWVSCTCFEAGP